MHQLVEPNKVVSPQYKRGDLARHRLTDDAVLILKQVEPGDRDRDIGSVWYLVRCGKVDPDGPAGERDYDRKIFCELELKPFKPVPTQAVPAEI